jgi:chromosome segregation ATPase
VGLLDVLRRPATTAADLKAKLDALDLGAAEAAVAKAEEARREGLLSGASDKELDRLEAALTSARRDVDRCAAARQEIERRLPELQLAERDAALIAERAAIEAEADAVKAEFDARWPKIVAEAVAMLDRLDLVERRAERFHSRVHDLAFSGSPAPVQGFGYPIEARLGLHSGDWHHGAGIRRNTVLLPIPNGSKGWPS